MVCTFKQKLRRSPWSLSDENFWKAAPYIKKQRFEYFNSFLCGTTKPHRWRRETWWWNKEVDDAITAKRQAFKAWKAGKCTQASYNTAKRISRRVVHHARHEADKVVYEGIDHKSSDVFHLANQMRKENVDVVGDKPVKNDTGEMSMG